MLVRRLRCAVSPGNDAGAYASETTMFTTSSTNPVRAIFLAALTAILIIACGTEDGSVENGDSCSSGKECKSGYCEADSSRNSTCQTRCIPNGNACGPSGQRNSACCSGSCGKNGTCE